MTWSARYGASSISANRARNAVRSRPNRLTGPPRASGARFGAFAAAVMTSARARAQLGGAEEVADLVLRVLERVGAVHGVLVDALGEVGADRAFRGLLRVGRAHDFPVLGDGVRAFEHRHHHR